MTTPNTPMKAAQSRAPSSEGTHATPSAAPSLTSSDIARICREADMIAALNRMLAADFELEC